ncbi:MAG: cohesin domain-containing protein [Anaerolineae bacterium]
MPKNKQFIIICLLTLIVIQLGTPEIGAVAPGPRVKLEPAESVVDLNETFTIQVMIEEAQDLGAFQLELTYNSSILQVEEAALGDFLESTGRSAVPVGPKLDNEEGRVTLGAMSFGSGPGAGGTGILATITCIAHGEGSTALRLQEVQVLDTAAYVQQIAVEDGQVIVRGTAAPTPAATATPKPTSTPEAMDTPTPAATALPSPTPPTTVTPAAKGSPARTLLGGLLAVLGLAILTILILRRRPEG